MKRAQPDVPREARTTTWAASLAEFSWLAAVVLVPLFFNPYTHRSFQQDKALLLRFVASAGLIGLAWQLIAHRGRRWVEPARPALWPLLTLSVCWLVATTFSIVPSDSFWGSYHRNQGLVTWLGSAVVLMSLVVFGVTRARRERLVDAMLFASVPASLHAVAQVNGFDPLQWIAVLGVERAHGAEGNAIFLAGFLAMLVPLALARLVQSWVDGGPRRNARVAAYAALLALQLAAIAYTQSRGPLLALCVALAVFAALTLLTSRWQVTLVVAAAVAGSVLAAAMLYFASASAGNVVVRDVSQEQGSSSARLAMWEGATELLQSSPIRTLVGWGPETLYYAGRRFQKPELSRFEVEGRVADRAHNRWLDNVTSLGVVGACAELWLLGVAVLLAARRFLGVASDDRRAWGVRPLAAGAVAAALAAALAFVVDGSWRLVGVAVTAGFWAGLLGSVVWHGLSRRCDAEEPARDFISLGLLVAIVAHAAETTVGIETPTTQLYLFAIIGLLAGQREDGALAASEKEGGESVYLPLLASAAIGLLGFEFYLPTFEPGASLPGLLLPAAGIWIAGVAFAVPAMRLRAAAAIPALGLAFVWLVKLWIDGTPGHHGNPGAGPLEAGRHLGQLVAFLYAGVAALLVGGAWVGVGSATRRHTLALCIAALGLGVSTAAAWEAVATSRADIFSKLGFAAERSGRLAAARTAFREARRLRPREDDYATSLVRVLVTDASRAKRPLSHRIADVEAAAGVLREAREANPLHSDHPRNAARVYRLWRGFLAPEQREAVTALAIESYAEAILKSPQEASLYRELATLYLEGGDLGSARTVFDRALRHNPLSSDLWWWRGEVLLREAEYQPALAAYERALELRENWGKAWSGKAMALARLGRTSEAIVAHEKVVELRPRDWRSHQNLAILYRQAGRLAEARAAAKIAMAHARGDKRARLEQFLVELDRATDGE